MADSIKGKIDEYYKLKQQYESKYEKAKKKILKDENLTTKEKQIRIKQIKEVCFNCKKLGGSLFLNDGKTLRIICGHKENPCKLNFEVNKDGLYFNAPTISKELSNNIEKAKDILIINKLEFLFSYISEDKVLEVLQKFKESYDSQQEVLDYVNNVIVNSTDSKDKERDIKDKEVELFVQIQEFKQLLSQYKEEGKQGYLDDALEIYTQKIIPISEQLRNTKYVENSVEYNDKDNTYHLIQEPYNLKTLEIALDI